MPYYPKHFIQTNLYTDGTEYQYKGSTNPYVGPYWKAGNGRFFAGKTPQDKTGYEIVPIEVVNNQTTNRLLDNPAYYPKARISIEGDSADIDTNVNVATVTNYINIDDNKKIINKTRILPINNPTLPTSKDYELGEFRRYFCKKINELQYFELSKEFYDLMVKKSPNVVWELYSIFSIPWQLTGEEKTVYNINKNIVDNISFNLKLSKFGDFLKHNYLKYYQE